MDKCRDFCEYLDRIEPKDCGCLFWILVAVLILVPYFVAAPLVLYPLYEDDLFTFYVNLAIGTILIIAVLGSYYKASVTSPGAVPKDWNPKSYKYSSLEYSGTTAMETKFCKNCNAWKPPRSHHCKTCNICVKKMDHHCVYINNCVGYHNHKMFFLFLVYAEVAIGYLLLLVILRSKMLLIQAFNKQKEFFNPMDAIIVSLLGMLYLALLLSIGMLFWWQIWLISQNKTSIEHFQARKKKREAEKQGIKKIAVDHPYHLGFISNLKATLGNNIWMWPFPTVLPGSGLEFPVSKQYEDDCKNQQLMLQEEGSYEEGTFEGETNEEGTFEDNSETEPSSPRKKHSVILI